MVQRELQIGGGRSEAQSALAGALSAAKSHYASVQQQLESRYYGSYIMFNIDTLDFVVAPTASLTHAKFIEKFGEDGRGWCTRIGVSAFATA
ncbi:MAG: hypothetical protein ABSD08_08345 [Xanthobacteraceae bacterium]|jgi:hypothetical protein